MSHDLTTTEFNFGASTHSIYRGELLKYNANAGGWSLDLHRVLVTDTFECVQRWSDGKPVETITAQPLPDVERLNREIPRDKYEQGLNGPRPPWHVQRGLHLIDPADGASFTFISGTVGAKIALERLNERVETMRKLRGGNVLPVVELGSRPMQTKFGERRRPDFTIVGWQSIGGGAKAIEHKVADVGTSVKPVTVSEELDDAIEF
jgi:hypothetical protein